MNNEKGYWLFGVSYFQSGSWVRWKPVFNLRVLKATMTLMTHHEQLNQGPEAATLGNTHIWWVKHFKNLARRREISWHSLLTNRIHSLPPFCSPLHRPSAFFVNVQTPSTDRSEDARHSSGAFQELDSLLGRIMSSREERRDEGRWWTAIWVMFGGWWEKACLLKLWRLSHAMIASGGEMISEDWIFYRVGRVNAHTLKSNIDMFHNLPR